MSQVCHGNATRVGEKPARPAPHWELLCRLHIVVVAVCRRGACRLAEARSLRQTLLEDASRNGLGKGAHLGFCRAAAADVAVQVRTG